MNIVFMGTPDFAVPSLAELVASGHNVKAVFSQPDRPRGRGYKLTPPPVKEFALSHEIEVFQPDSLKDEAVEKQLRGLNPDIIVVVAYGKLLPKAVLDIPKYGCVNVHGSLLPKYRGAAPIQWSVLNGDEFSGVTTMYMAEGLDTGDIILSEQTKIFDNETSSELYDRLSEIGAKLLVKTLKLIESGKDEKTAQDDAAASYAPMLSKSMSKIDFEKSAKSVHDQIRGLSEWPCASCECLGKTLKVYHSKTADGFTGAPGELLDSKRFIVACGSGAVEFTEVQLQGGKRTDGESFLRGRRLEKGKKLWEQ